MNNQSKIISDLRKRISHKSEKWLEYYVQYFLFQQIIYKRLTPDNFIDEFENT